MTPMDLALYVLIGGVVLVGVIGFIVAVWGDKKER
jgi:preprotein translocase subunit Sss1